MSNPKQDRPIRTAIVGLGRMGWGYHAQRVLDHPGFELTAVCDLEPDRIREAQARADCRGYSRFGDMVKDPHVELIVIASQSKDHQRLALRALRAGKHVFVEKPTARQVAGIDGIIKAAQKADRLVTMHHNHRTFDECLFVKEIVGTGKLGRIFRVRRCEASFSRRNDWQTLRKYGGGIIGNWVIHLVDQCLQLDDSPVKRVWSSVRQVINPGDAEDDVKALVTLESGIVFDLEMTYASAYRGPTWVVLGDRGTLWIEEGQARLRWVVPGSVNPLEVEDSHKTSQRNFGLAPGEEKMEWNEESMPAKPQNPCEEFYENLYQAIRNGKELLVTPESARLTYDVVARIRRNDAARLR